MSLYDSNAEIKTNVIYYPYNTSSMSINIDAFFSMFKAHYDKNYCFNGETHDFWECMYVVNGKLQVSGDDRVYELTTGDMIFHKPMELHKFTVTGKTGATIFVFSFKLSGSLSKHFENKVFSLNPEQNKLIDVLIDFMEKEVENFGISSLEFPWDFLLKPSESSDTYLQKIVSFIYLLFLSLADYNNKAMPISNPETILFKKAVTFMTENLDRNLSIDDIARHCNTSLSGIKRIFSKYGGKSVHKYFLDLKLKKAISLLESGMSVQEVTDALNFSSQSYFSSAFKREIGKNPSDFK